MNPKDSAASTQAQSSSEASGSTEPRRPYRTPALRHLGSVRELTLGASKTNTPDQLAGYHMGTGGGKT